MNPQTEAYVKKVARIDASVNAIRKLTDALIKELESENALLHEAYMTGGVELGMPGYTVVKITIKGNVDA
jgi:hypothetical protein